jgi:predicted transcriptional regulator
LKKKTRPTDAELVVLRALWRGGPSTVRQVHEALSRDRDLGYTTVLKVLQVMTAKGLVTRDTSMRSHVYAPTSTEGQTQSSLVEDLVSRAFGGSATQLVMRALGARPASAEELAQIRELLDRHERGEL